MKLILLSLMLTFSLLIAHPAQAEYGDVILDQYASREGMRPVVFPHWFHRIRFRCKVCHTELGFRMGVTENNIRMENLIFGEYCGACHNTQIAWGLENCDLCHSGTRFIGSGILAAPRPGGG